jgi:tRNA threonylcarbamoyl adenosine modification protein (Sua5/YciO/YrdC/YwlC family)
MGPVSEPPESDEPTPVLVEEEASTTAGYQRFDCTDTAADHHLATDAARKAIEAGDCIVLPTDTVYGIGADAFSPDAVQRLLDAKARGRDMPPPVLIGESSLIRALATDVPEPAKQLVDKHWPGALTVICKIQPSLRMDLGETGGTIALRVPDHDLARAVLRQTGPMAVSSANRSGQPPSLTCDDAVEQLGGSVAVYLDGGQLGGSDQRPSTIVDFSQYDEGEVLRRGAIEVEVLRETLPDLRDATEEALPAHVEGQEASPAADSRHDESGSANEEPGSRHDEPAES